jgi:hypothetical protein
MNILFLSTAKSKKVEVLEENKIDSFKENFINISSHINYLFMDYLKHNFNKVLWMAAGLFSILFYFLTVKYTIKQTLKNTWQFGPKEQITAITNAYKDLQTNKYKCFGDIMWKYTTFLYEVITEILKIFPTSVESIIHIGIKTILHLGMVVLLAFLITKIFDFLMIFLKDYFIKTDYNYIFFICMYIMFNRVGAFFFIKLINKWKDEKDSSALDFILLNTDKIKLILQSLLILVLEIYIFYNIYEFCPLNKVKKIVAVCQNPIIQYIDVSHDSEREESKKNKMHETLKNTTDPFLIL